MEQCSPLGWIYYPEEEEMGELKRFLVQTTMELEATILGAHDEISRRDEELTRMRDLLTAAVKERDEAHHKCHELLVDNTCLHQQLQLQQHKPAAFVAPDTKSDSDESGLATPSSSTLSSSLPPNLAATLGKQRPLPEKGRLLQAVMDAGPLLQTLLLAGPLPQWQHPPPHLDRIDIPPVHPRLL